MSNICISADYRQAAYWYIKGMEIEAEAIVRPSSDHRIRLEDSDEGIGGIDEQDTSSNSSSASLPLRDEASLSSNEKREMNLDTLSDLSFALTSLYRIGKLTAASESNTHDCKDKGQDLYCKGSRIAYRLTQHAIFKTLRSGLRTSQVDSAHGPIRATSLDSNDVLTRGVYVALCYLLALTSYPSGHHSASEAADHTESVEWWEKAIAIQSLPGGIGSSRPAEDLVQKAKYRVDMIRIAKEREDEMNLMTQQRHYHRFHSLKSGNPRISSRNAWEPLLSPTELLDTPLSPPKVSPVVKVLQHIKPSLPHLHSYQVTEKVHPSNRPIMSREYSAPAVARSPDIAPKTPPRAKPKFSLAENSPASTTTSIYPRSKTRSILSTTSFRTPRLTRPRSSSITTQISIDSISVPSASYLNRGSTTSLSSLWSTQEREEGPSRTGSYVSLSDLYKGGEMKQTWRAKALALQAGSALKHVWSYTSLTSMKEDAEEDKGGWKSNSAVNALEKVLERDAEALSWQEVETIEEASEEEEEQVQPTPPIRVQAPTPTTTYRPSYLQQRSSLRQSFSPNALRSGSGLDPTLSALEANSVINAKSRCAFCGKKGLNFREFII